MWGAPSFSTKKFLKTVHKNFRFVLFCSAGPLYAHKILWLLDESFVTTVRPSQPNETVTLSKHYSLIQHILPSKPLCWRHFYLTRNAVSHVRQSGIFKTPKIVSTTGSDGMGREGKEKSEKKGKDWSSPKYAWWHWGAGIQLASRRFWHSYVPLFTPMIDVDSKHWSLYRHQFAIRFVMFML